MRIYSDARDKGDRIKGGSSEKKRGLIKDNVVLSVAALKVKLTLRRPINQLVAQGIMPCK